MSDRKAESERERERRRAEAANEGSEMERTTPVRKPHTSTADLLTWSEIPPPESAVVSIPLPVRNVQPSDGISKVVFGGKVTDEEAESLSKRAKLDGNEKLLDFVQKL